MYLLNYALIELGGVYMETYRLGDIAGFLRFLVRYHVPVCMNQAIISPNR